MLAKARQRPILPQLAMPTAWIFRFGSVIRVTQTGLLQETWGVAALQSNGVQKVPASAPSAKQTSGQTVRWFFAFCADRAARTTPEALRRSALRAASAVSAAHVPRN